MGTRMVWLQIALGILASLVAGPLAGRNAEDPTPTPVGPGSAGAATQEKMRTDPCRLDASGHTASFVTVEPGVELEVLDWGGTGEALVLLTGLGDNAHVFDQFAYQFNDRFHVIGITRRGFGRSSQPAHGYDVETRARDDIRVLDKLNIREAVFVGHSVSGTEMNTIAAVYPGRVRKLVYLDALDVASGGWAALPQPPPSPEPTSSDLESVQRLAAADARTDGYRKPLAALCNTIRTDPSGRVLEAITPPEIFSKILAGFKKAEYDRIKAPTLGAPTLGILNKMSPQFRAPYYWSLDLSTQKEYRHKIRSLAKWIETAIRRFRSGIKNSRVIELHDTNHYVFIVDEALVVREMRRFLLEE
jgi:non-heme chloroperoxidase